MVFDRSYAMVEFPSQISNILPHTPLNGQNGVRYTIFSRCSNKTFKHATKEYKSCSDNTHPVQATYLTLILLILSYSNFDISEGDCSKVRPGS